MMLSFEIIGLFPFVLFTYLVLCHNERSVQVLIEFAFSYSLNKYPELESYNVSNFTAPFHKLV